MAATAAELYEHLSTQLTPLIGDLGLSAILARSLHLSQREFPWLGQPDASEPDTSALARLRLSLERQPAASAAAGAATLLATFCQVLATLIGDGLTRRSLREAWPDISLKVHVEEASR